MAMAAAEHPSFAAQTPDVGGSAQPPPDREGRPASPSADAPAEDSAPPAAAASGPRQEETSRDHTPTQDGATPAGDHSFTSNSTGQAPEPSSSTGLEPAPAANPTPVAQEERPAATEGGEQPVALTTATPTGKRRREIKDEGLRTPSSSEQPPTPRRASKRAKTSFLSRVRRICMSCVRPSGRDHEIDVEEGASRAAEVHREKEKTKKREKKEQQQEPSELEKIETTVESSTASEDQAIPHVPAPLAIVPAGPLPETEVFVPPTPSQLLPRSETQGVTAGAVQPPGSTGHSIPADPIRTPGNESGEESDGSFTEEDVLQSLIHVDIEAEEQLLIQNGGAGIPIGPDGRPQPLLPPIAPEHKGRKCLVLDLDETLVHSSLKSQPVPSPDYIVPVEIESYWHNFYVLKRPGVDLFLQKMGEIYEVVVFTASLSKYADPVLDRLDPGRAVAHRLFRESCYNHRGNYVKDLSQLGRPISDTIIIDNSPASYIFHPHNAVPISSWFNDPHDTELADLCPFLEDLGAAPGDVRGVLNPNV